jgi:hypothetical protein
MSPDFPFGETLADLVQNLGYAGKKPIGLVKEYI